MLGEKIALLRKKKELSQYELASRLGFSRGKLANYEQGTRQPDYETLKKIAAFFDVSTDYLLEHEVDNTNEKKKETEEELTKNVKQMIEVYSKLPPNKQKIIDRLANDLLDD